MLWPHLPGSFESALALLDRRIAREIDRLRARYQLSAPMSSAGCASMTSMSMR